MSLCPDAPVEHFLAASTEVVSLETAILVVICASLIVLAKMVSDLRREVRALREAQAAAPAPQPAPLSAAQPSPASAAPADGIPRDVFAAIVSAIHFTLGGEHNVVAIGPVESMMWSREGRRSIFGSHSIR